MAWTEIMNIKHLIARLIENMSYIQVAFIF